MVGMRTPLVLVGLAVLAGCSASTTVSFTGTSSSSGSGAGGEGTGSTGSTGSTGHTGSTGSASSSGAGAGSTSSGNASSGSGTSTGSGFTFDAGPLPDGGNTGSAEVYGQSPTTLYKLDPLTKVLTTVGDFVGCDTVIDIALNKSGQMWATTFSGFYAVNPATAVCTLIASGTTYPNSLSFVPAGTLDPSVEALVGYEGTDYVRIDLTSGAITTVGSLGTQGYTSSGDVVSVIGGGTYLTVQGGPQNCGDCIIEVDPKTGALMSFIGDVGHADVYGLAYWGGSAYGFDDTGELFQIDLTSGAPTTIAIPNAPFGLVFYGAGSTTSAPLTTN